MCYIIEICLPSFSLVVLLPVSKVTKVSLSHLCSNHLTIHKDNF